MISVSFYQQTLRGGADIRRQDMPFVSNKMDFSRLEAMVMYTLPRPADLAVRANVTRTLTGRNVGDSTAFGAGPHVHLPLLQIGTRGTMNGTHRDGLAAVVAFRSWLRRLPAGITQSEDRLPLAPSSTDANAGNWRMLVLSGPTQIAVPPPGLVTSDAYRAELTAIKAAQAGLTAEQREVVSYWSAGGVIRWNQILRELVALQPPAGRARTGPTRRPTRRIPSRTRSSRSPTRRTRRGRTATSAWRSSRR